MTGIRRERALAELLDRLADERGRLDTPEDEAEIARYMRLLGGRADEPGNSGPADAAGASVEAGGGVVQTADPDDLGRLAAPYRTVVIESLARRKGSPD
jgi:hypothetical protein